MNLFTQGKNLHHAYCIVGEAEQVILELEKFFEKELKFSIHSNPDFWYGEYDTMDTEDSRTLKELHYNRPTVSDKKIFVLQANFITEKAQNAMLKFFEEPVGGTHFFIIIPSVNGIIPTLRSRLMIVEHESVAALSKINAKSFLKMSVGERMDAVKKLAESISHSTSLATSDEEESPERASKIQVFKFFNALESELNTERMQNIRGKNAEEYEKNKKLIQALESLEKVRQYSSEQSPSLKMLMEYIALALPIL